MESFSFDVAPASPRNLTALNVSVPYDDLLKHSQLFFQGSDIVWMMTSGALVMLMIPAICLFNSGASDRSSALIMFRLPFITTAFVGVQWYLWGYSLAFSPAIVPDSSPWSWYGGDTRANALRDTIARPVGADGAKIPELVFVFHHCMFASFTAAVVCGGALRKVSVGRFLVFISIWSILVYDVIARWSWHPAGWSRRLGSMDFAGGTAVHITSGTTVAAITIFYTFETKGFRHCLRRLLYMLKERVMLIFYCCNYSRKDRDNARQGDEEHERGIAPPGERDLNGGLFTTRTQDRETATDPPASSSEPEDDGPHNVNNIVLGTALLWIGWFGFNGGSALGGNLRAVSACTSTHVAACAGGSANLIIFWFLNSLAQRFPARGHDPDTYQKPSVILFCDGAVIALVAITPAAGYVPVWSSPIFGLVSCIFVLWVRREARDFLKDDLLDVFAIHCGGGWVGMFLTGCFADQSVVGLDGYSTIPDRSVGERLRYQMLDAFAGLFYTFFMTLAILYGLKILRGIFRCRWEPLFDRDKPVRDKLEATVQHTWRPKDEHIV